MTPGVQLKSKAQIELMRRAGAIVREVLDTLSAMVRPGVTTAELDERAREITETRGAVPAFLGYPAAARDVEPFPGVICASVNEVIVHGIPNKKPLRAGDIISIDYGCSVDGYFADAATTVSVGEVNDSAQKLLRITEECLQRAIEQCVVGNRIGDISSAVQEHAENNGFGVVREFVGHGIGASMHEPPQVPNFGKPHQGRPLRAGMVLAIEPMITIGSFETKLLDDGWTAITNDGSLAAHFEHTVAITESKPLVITRS